jgi:hypothetical protein
MELSPKGPVGYPLEKLTPEQFEILTFLLARAEFPEVVHRTTLVSMRAVQAPAARPPYVAGSQSIFRSRSAGPNARNPFAAPFLSGGRY